MNTVSNITINHDNNEVNRINITAGATVWRVQTELKSTWMFDPVSWVLRIDGYRFIHRVGVADAYTEVRQAEEQFLDRLFEKEVAPYKGDLPMTVATIVAAVAVHGGHSTSVREFMGKAFPDVEWAAAWRFTMILVPFSNSSSTIPPGFNS